mmetsp:Transcript_32073/g.57991  ORF Transcript_32073/g.57991 Transcript_32073/m.57991 type:complete len:215 (+) Transcript_32073:99-743(+)|eukprot:CAMPEP_0202494512 /NCGR_PEP_ID=MMETSP1361-20130828/12149_1 /ASSEMBLY_ACC=CAM_ASM_000849 /TAXON_ID=210615 /ORGANISM="Staurosira complex sp., Strain CCMP2646" /LENGTH=214 /DNA_ID=CAMNT_0049125079 /DNA_START=88 /DNA_END=732 /DNA_ORIENTATION=-
MKLNLVVFCGVFASASAFIGAPQSLASNRAHHGLGMAVKLIAEPEGGEELVAISPMADTRMKNMGEFDGDLSEKADGTVYNFWLTSRADGDLIKKTRTTLSKEAAKNANFPGFRKGQIPPYAQPQITTFAVQESLIRTVESAVESFGLKALPGSDGDVTINEEVKDMCQGYKVGDSLEFTATLNAIFDPDTKTTIEARKDAAEEKEEEALASSD